MDSNRYIPVRVVFFSVILCVSLPLAALSQNANDLANAANKIIREAERDFYKGKIDESSQKMDAAREKLDALKSVDPSNRKLKSLERKYKRIKKIIDRKLGAASKTLLPKSSSQKQGNVSKGKLPAGVTKRLRDIDRNLKNVERYISKKSESAMKQAKYDLGNTRELFEEIEKQYSGQFDVGHPDYVKVKTHFEKLGNKVESGLGAIQQDKADRKASEAMKEKESAEWVSGFQAYLSYPGIEGHNPDKLVFVPGTSEPEKFSDALRRYENLKAFYERYKTTSFPHGKTDKLIRLADKEAPGRISEFEAQFHDRVDVVAKGAEKAISDAMKFLEKNDTWKKDKNVKPPIVDRKRLSSIERMVKTAKTALPKGDARVKNIEKKFADLVAIDREHRQIRARRTFMFPEKYKGKDRNELIRKAKQILAKEKPGSKVLKISLYKPGWEEKTEEEWSDTSKTRWVKKTFRQTNAQVAAKDTSGVFLHTLYLAKDRISGGWSGVYGHIMYSDPMAEANAK